MAKVATIADLGKTSEDVNKIGAYQGPTKTTVIRIKVMKEGITELIKRTDYK